MIEMKVEERPLQLINFQDSKLIINSEALEFIESIKEEIVVVCVIGKARTGKSYLMNLLLENDKDNVQQDGVSYTF